MTVDTKNIGYKWRGAHNPLATYGKGDVVMLNGIPHRHNGAAFTPMSGPLAASGHQLGAIASGSGPSIPTGIPGQNLKWSANGPEYQFDSGRRSTGAVALAKTFWSNPERYNGNFSNAAIMSDGGVMTWGLNQNGCLGNGTTTQINRTLPGRVGFSNAPGMSKLFALYAGSYMAIDEFGRLWAWGYNNQGQLGVGDTTTRYTPVLSSGSGELPDSEQVVDIAYSAHYSGNQGVIALTANGNAYFAGYNAVNMAGINDNNASENILSWRRIPVDFFVAKAFVCNEGSYPGTALLNPQGHCYFAGHGVFTDYSNNQSGTAPRHVLWNESIQRPVVDFSIANSCAYVNTSAYSTQYYFYAVVHADGGIQTKQSAYSMSLVDTTHPSYQSARYTPDDRISDVAQLLCFSGQNETMVALKKDGTIWACGYKQDIMQGGATNPYATTAYLNENVWQQLTELGSNNTRMVGMGGQYNKTIAVLKPNGTAAVFGNAQMGQNANGRPEGGYRGDVLLRGNIIDVTLQGDTWVYPGGNMIMSTFLLSDGSIYTSGHGGYYQLGNDDDGDTRSAPSIVLT